MNHAQEDRTMDDAELIVLGAVSADPMRHAPLVAELVHDRLDRPARGLDPMIVTRHRDDVLAHMAELAPRLMPEGSATPAYVAQVIARSAVAHAIHHTHQIMMALGHLHDLEEQGALATGRTLFAGEIGGDAAAVMTRAN